MAERFDWGSRGPSFLQVASGFQDLDAQRQAQQIAQQRSEIDALRAKWDAAQEAQKAALRPLELTEAQYGIRGQLLGTVETPEDFQRVLPEIQRLGLPAADLPEQRKSEAWQTFAAPKPQPEARVAPKSWLPSYWNERIPGNAPLLQPEAQQERQIPTEAMVSPGMAPEEITTSVQRAARRGLPLATQETLKTKEAGQDIQWQNLWRNQEKDQLSRDWMQFQKVAKIQGMTEAEAQREFQRRMGNAQLGIDYARLDLSKKESETRAATTPKFTADQTNSATFGRRLEQALPYLDKAYQEFDPTTASGAVAIAAAQKGGLASLASNPAAKSAVVGELNILSAILRKESGAAIAPSEYESAGKVYFPRFGDSPALRAQKRATLDQALAGLRTGAGAAWDATPLASSGGPGASMETRVHQGVTYQRKAGTNDPWKRVK